MIWLTAAHREQMRAHASACLPEEACGVIGGLQGRASMVVAVTNELHSPVRFRMEAVEQLRAFQALENAGQELIGIFHSHPNGPAAPSATDLAEFTYPGVLVLILSPGENGWTIRAFELETDSFRESPICLLE